MVSSTDMPDWCLVNVCGADEKNGFAGEDGVWQSNVYKQAGVWLTRDIVLKLFEASPISKVEAIKTPILFAIGSKDKRVPNYQSTELYFHLKSRNIACKILQYEDSHALSLHSYDYWFNFTFWILNYLPK